MGELDEAGKAAKALLFFCDDMDPREQWTIAVQFMREMDHFEKAKVWNLMTPSEMSSVTLSKRRTAYKHALKEAEENPTSIEGNVIYMNKIKDLEEELAWAHQSHDNFFDSGVHLANGKHLQKPSALDPSTTPDLTAFLAEQRSALEALQSAVKALETGDHGVKKLMDETSPSVERSLNTLSKTVDTLAAKVDAQASTAASLNTLSKTVDTLAAKVDAQTSASDSLRSAVEALETRAAGGQSEEALKGLEAKVVEKITSTIAPLEESLKQLEASLPDSVGKILIKLTNTIAPLEDKVANVEALLSEMPTGHAMTEQMQSIVGKINDTYVPVNESVKAMTENLSSISSSLSDLTKSESKHLVDITHAVGAGVKLAMEEVASDEKARAESLAAGFDIGPIQDQIKLIDTKIAEQNTEIERIQAGALEQTDKIELVRADLTGEVQTIKKDVFDQKTAMDSLASKEDVDLARKDAADGIAREVGKAITEVESSHKLINSVMVTNTQHIKTMEDALKDKCSTADLKSGFEAYSDVIVQLKTSAETVDKRITTAVQDAETRIVTKVDENLKTSAETVDKRITKAVQDAETRIETNVNVKIATEKERADKLEGLISAQDTWLANGINRIEGSTKKFIKEQEEKMAETQGEVTQLKPIPPHIDVPVLNPIPPARVEPAAKAVRKPAVGRWVAPASSVEIPDHTAENAKLKESIENAEPRIDNRRSRPAGSTAPAAQVTRQGVAPAGQRPVGASMEDSLDDPVEDSQGFQRPTTMLAYLSRQFGP